MAIGKTPMGIAGKVLPSDAVALIDELYPMGFRQEFISPLLRLDAVNCSKLAAILKAVESIDPRLFILHGTDYVEFVVSVDEIRAAVDFQRAAFLNNPHATIKNLTALPMFGDRHPISILHDSLSRCPDHFPVSGSSELMFIDEEETRVGLLADLGAVHEALAASNWKAATVLGGALVEPSCCGNWKSCRGRLPRRLRESHW